MSDHDHGCPEEDLCEQYQGHDHEHDDEEEDNDHDHDHDTEYGNEHLAIGLTCAAGFTTMLGAMVVLCLPKKDLEGGMARWRRAMAVGYAGAAGVMAYLAFAELFAESQNYMCCASSTHYKAAAAASLFGGALLTFAIETAVHHVLDQHTSFPTGPTEADPLVSSKTGPEAVATGDMLRVSTTTLIGLALHNLPEGIALYIGTLANANVGYTLFIAIALHNVPAGAAAAIPFFAATNSRWKAFLWGSVTGLVQPLAALLAWGALETRLSPMFFGVTMGATAGILAVVSLGGLFPLALKLAPSQNWAVGPFFAGCALMAVTMSVMEEFGGHGH